MHPSTLLPASTFYIIIGIDEKLTEATGWKLWRNKNALQKNKILFLSVANNSG